MLKKTGAIIVLTMNTSKDTPTVNMKPIVLKNIVREHMMQKNEHTIMAPAVVMTGPVSTNDRLTAERLSYPAWRCS